MQSEIIQNEGGTKSIGTFKLIILYGLTLSLLYLAFWLGYYFLSGWLGIVAAVALVAVAVVIFVAYKKRVWSAITLCLAVSTGIGLGISTFYVVLAHSPSRFFGLVLLGILVYKSLQCMLMAKLKCKSFITILLIILEVGLTIFFFATYEKNAVNSQIGFSGAVAIFLSFGQLALYKFGANDMWRTIALSYVIGFVFIILFIVILIISFLAEDGSAFEIFGEISFGGLDSAPAGGAKVKKNKRA